MKIVNLHRHVLVLVLTLGFTFLPVAQAQAQANQLPRLGDASSSLISLEQERELGEEFLRAVRAQAPTVADPVLKDYLEHLIYSLAEHSQLQDRRLELVILASKQLNAFAAPGGVVGVNLGLFLNAENQHEISAILAHELAHLSQRHFARQLDVGRKQGLTTIAGLLAGIILMATTGGDAGLAAITTAQAAAQNEALRYSRGREAEADRVGINTLAAAGMDPRAMASMFERLSRVNRFNGEQLPEFLLTHPVTKSRISDAYNQTQGMPLTIYPLSLDYQLMRNRVQVMTADQMAPLIARFREGARHTDPVRRAANEYGLVLALTQATEFDEAMRYLRPLQSRYPGKIVFTVAEAALHLKAERYDDAVGVLEEALRINPTNFPLNMKYAEALLKAGDASKAEAILVKQSFERPRDADVWYLLAETYGKANNITGVHQARAEYFVLTGRLDQAIRQLEYALPLTRDNYQLNAKIVQRIRDIHEIRKKRL